MRATTDNKSSIESISALPSTFTIDNADQALQQLLANSNQPNIMVDLSNVKHCDSAGLAALIEAKAILLEQKKAISYQHPQQQLIDLAVFLKVDSLLFT